MPKRISVFWPRKASTDAASAGTPARHSTVNSWSTERTSPLASSSFIRTLMTLRSDALAKISYQRASTIFHSATRSQLSGAPSRTSLGEVSRVRASSAVRRSAAGILAAPAAGPLLPVNLSRRPMRRSVLGRVHSSAERGESEEGRTAARKVPCRLRRSGRLQRRRRLLRLVRRRDGEGHQGRTEANRARGDVEPVIGAERVVQL